MPRTKPTIPSSSEPSSSCDQPADNFEMKSSTRDKIIANIQNFLGLLKESKSSQKESDRKSLTDANIHIVNLLMNLGDHKHEFRNKKVKREENGEHSSETGESDEDASVLMSVVDKDKLIRNLIGNRGYVDEFCNDAKQAGAFKQDVSNVLSLMAMKKVEDSEMTVIFVEDDENDLNEGSCQFKQFTSCLNDPLLSAGESP